MIRPSITLGFLILAFINAVASGQQQQQESGCFETSKSALSSFAWVQEDGTNIPLPTKIRLDDQGKQNNSSVTSIPVQMSLTSDVNCPILSVQTLLQSWPDPSSPPTRQWKCLNINPTTTASGDNNNNNNSTTLQSPILDIMLPTNTTATAQKIKLWIFAVPFHQPNCKGRTKGKSIQQHVHIIPPANTTITTREPPQLQPQCTVTRFELYSSKSNELLHALSMNKTTNLCRPATGRIPYNVRAVVSCTNSNSTSSTDAILQPSKVKFQMSAVSSENNIVYEHIEKSTPYFLAGNVGSDILPLKRLPVGTYHVTATPYFNNNNIMTTTTPSSGEASFISFTLSDCKPTTTSHPVTSPTTFAPSTMPSGEYHNSPTTPTPTSSPTVSPNTKSYKTITSTQELYDAVDAYVAANASADSNVSWIYGHPIGSWDVSGVSDFKQVFSSYRNPALATFNEPLNDWNVSGAVSLMLMFEGAHQFNQDLNQWDVSSVVSVEMMFIECYAFNGNVLTWNFTSLQKAYGMFLYAYNFNQNVCAWGLSIQDLNADLLNMFLGTSCPVQDNPYMYTFPPSPFCYTCQ